MPGVQRRPWVRDLEPWPTKLWVLERATWLRWPRTSLLKPTDTPRGDPGGVRERECDVTLSHSESTMTTSQDSESEVLAIELRALNLQSVPGDYSKRSIHEISDLSDSEDDDTGM